MYAVIQTGGKQYRVQENDVIEVEKLDKEVGSKIELDVIMLCDGKEVKIADDVKNSKVVAEVVATGKADKIVVYKYKAKKNVRKKQGHRQPFTQIKILEIK